MPNQPSLPQPEPEEPESKAKEAPEGDPEVRVLIARALEHVGEGRRLPRPATWKELLAGMVVWLGEHWEGEDKERRPCGNCGASDWEYGPVVSFEADPRWPAGEGDGSYPYFQIGCRKCGNTIFVNALSVFESQAEAEAEES
jgi:hypothetical protein